MRVLICGGRDFTAWEWLFEQLRVQYHQRGPFSLIIHGGARGVDTFAGEWAAGHGIPVSVYPADWKRDGKAAGVLRNQRMLDEGKPDLVIAFHGGRGTEDMVTRARKAGVNVVRI